MKWTLNKEDLGVDGFEITVSTMDKNYTGTVSLRTEAAGNLCNFSLSIKQLNSECFGDGNWVRKEDILYYRDRVNHIIKKHGLENE